MVGVLEYLEPIDIHSAVIVASSRCFKYASVITSSYLLLKYLL